jgi:REP-associated tyrosine transposase
VPRKPREEVAGGVYHVYARGNRREAIFMDEDDRRSYLETFGVVASELRWRPLAYCLMTNHVHHLIELTQPNLGAGMRQAHGRYARHFNHRHGTGGGHLFEKRFGSARAANVGTVMYFACYVLLNPVRAGLCAHPRDYRWSSYAATVAGVREPRWLEGARLLAAFGSPTVFEHVVESVQLMGAAGFEPATSRV